MNIVRFIRNMLLAIREHRKQHVPPFGYAPCLYAAYREAGEPHGRTREGLQRWLSEQIAAHGVAWLRGVTN